MNHLRYLTNHYDEKIKTIKEFGAPLNFLFITDMHNRLTQYDAIRRNVDHPFELAVNAIDSMQYILDRCPEITFGVCGGDAGCDYHFDPAYIRASYYEVMDAFSRLSVPVHWCIGNHDDVSGSWRSEFVKDYNPGYVILPDELHKIFMKQNPTPENYYYWDNDTPDGDHYRLIFLNTSDNPYVIDPRTGQYSDQPTISEKQVEWFEKEALNTDRKIIIFSHVPLSSTGIIGMGSEDYLYIHGVNYLVNQERVYKDIKECKNVIALISGHVHYDNVHYDDDLPNITSLCSFAQEWAVGWPKRDFGTITETAFDVFSIKGDRIYITRFGAGTDRIVPLWRVRNL